MRITPADKLNAEIKELRKQDGIFSAIQLQKKEEELRQLRKKHWDQIQGVQKQISKHAKRFSVAIEKPYEELRTVAEQGALRAAETFEEKYGVKFTTHADSHIRQSMVVWFKEMYVPRGYQHRNEGRDCPVQVNSTSGLSEDDYQVVDNKSVDPAKEAELSLDNAEMIDKIKKCLTKREFEILWQHLGIGYTRKEVGKLIGVSRERVKQILTDAITKVRQKMPEMVEGKNEFDKLIDTRREWRIKHKIWHWNCQRRARSHKKKLGCLSVQATLFD